MISVLVACCEWVNLGAQVLLEQTYDIRVIDKATNSATMLQKIRKLRPDIVLLDVDLFGMTLEENIESIKKRGQKRLSWSCHAVKLEEICSEQSRRMELATWSGDRE
jgi:DNA-binding NarL/FixJ family response regulator